jgi:hypothetical protein
MRMRFNLLLSVSSDDDDDDNPCAFPGGWCINSRCFDDNGTAVCGECDSDDDCEFGCQDFQCRDCRVDSDCGAGDLCDHSDGLCFTAVCDFDFDCDASASEVCIDERCQVVSCEALADMACLDEGLLCSANGTCQLPDDVTGGCNLGPQRTGGGPLLLSASLTRAADEDARCPTGAAWRVETTAALAAQATPRIFVSGLLEQELVAYSSEADAVSFDVPVERSVALVCTALSAPLQVQVNVFDGAERQSNGVCLDIVE